MNPSLLQLKDQVVMPKILPTGSKNRAAVFLLIHEIEGDPCLLLTKRTDLVHSHKGQISFPGGYWEAQDKDLLETALRETHEEVGISSVDINVWGMLPQVKTRFNVEITPWLGCALKSPLHLRVEIKEVERTLSLPLPYLFEKGINPVKVSLENFSVKSVGIQFKDDLIWGATAHILAHLISMREPTLSKVK